MATSTDDDRDRLLRYAEALGFAAVGVTTAEPFTETRVDIERRRDAGLSATMQFTYRNPSRATTPTEALPGAAALVVGAWPYGGEDPEAPPWSAGRVARFARSNPYAGLRSAALDAVAERLRSDGHRARVLMDDNALVDRAAAYRAGLGWWGKNTNLLLSEGGSWHLLGSVLTDVALTPSGVPVPDGCGSCRRCLDACPTGALEPGVLDARRCLTWLLQARGDFPREFRVALGDRIYGCDDCQVVCPPSRSADRPRSDPDDAWVDVVAMLGLDDVPLIEQVGHWYIPGRQARFVRRNLLVVLGNVGDATDPRVVSAVQRALADPEPVVRGHAVWAASRLGLDRLLRSVADDPDPTVRDEFGRTDAMIRWSRRPSLQ